MSEQQAYMREALLQAEQAAAAGEVPVGAVVVHQGRIVGRGHNRSITRQDVTAHAEIEAIRQASQTLGNYRLDDCELYVTLEPCVMCSGAILGARMARVVYGAREPKTGAAGSVTNLFADTRLNHHTDVAGGVLEAECGAALQAFFQQRRQAQQADREKSFLRDDALRADKGTCAAWPADLRSVFFSGWPALEGLRLHVLLAGEGAATGVLALHGPAQWSAAYVTAGQALAGAGLALIAPDLIGFGLSDKPKKARWHSLAKHAAVLRELLERLPHTQLTLVCPPSMWPLAHLLLPHPKLLRCMTIDEPVLTPQLQDAPYPDAGHRMGPRALADLLGAATLPPAAAQHLGADWPRSLSAVGYCAP